MKKTLVLAVLLMAGFAGYSQKIGVVDTQYILDNMSEYKIAQEQIDELAVEWQKEIEKKFKEIDEMYKKFQAEAPILPEDEKKRREEAIVTKEKEVKELQKKRFGKEGDLFKKRQELIQPIQEKVYNAIKEIADAENYAIILDKSSGTAVAYVRSKFDISDDVLKKLGYTPGGMGTGN
ncbi:MAG TPA: OmpH family outer membrane protein [Bacteroidales bacterium]|nr:OmpH family outer membrane protein [Bacteroidales bacterium]HRZ48496.1 OmpH family outer membrane protein [Bacteroidales bacterium]